MGLGQGSTLVFIEKDTSSKGQELLDIWMLKEKNNFPKQITKKKKEKKRNMTYENR